MDVNLGSWENVRESNSSNGGGGEGVQKGGVGLEMMRLVGS